MNATLYTYHGIQYTYADLQAAYRRQQDETHKAIDSGNYAAACNITRKDVREYLPQMTAPERAAPERSEPPRTIPKRKNKLLRILRRLLK